MAKFISANTSKISIPTHSKIDSLTSRSMCFWMYRTTNTAASGVIWGKQNVGSPGGWTLITSSGGNGRLGFDSTMTVTAISVRTATNSFLGQRWFYVCFTWDGSTTAANAKFYINLKETSYAVQTNGSGTIQNDNQNVFIGVNWDGVTNPISCNLEYMRLYNRVITLDEMEKNMFSRTPVPSGLIGSWDLLDEPLERLSLDSSLYRENGTNTALGFEENHCPIYKAPPNRFFTPNLWTSGIQFDAVSNSGYQAAQSTYTWNHTCTGNSRFLSVDISLLSAGATVTALTYNGVAMSLIVAKSTITSVGRIECWGLVNPTSGTNTISVTLSSSIASAGTAVSYSGVHQTSPTEASNSNQATNVGATDATVDITTVANQDWIHAAIATDDASVTAGQTNRNNVTGVGGSGADEDFGPQSPGLKTMNYTNVGALQTWAIAGYAIRPVGSSSLITGTLLQYPGLEGRLQNLGGLFNG